jgi:hypothetical protein
MAGQERAFSQTDLGKAFNHFKHAYTAMIQSEFNEGMSYQRLQDIDTEAKEAERALRMEMEKLLSALPTPGEPAPQRSGPLRDRRDYMREYMRRKRAVNR